jgi:hypothetical protein
MDSSTPNRCCILCPQSLVASTFPQGRTGHMESSFASAPSMRLPANRIWSKSASTTAAFLFGNAEAFQFCTASGNFCCRSRLQTRLTPRNQHQMFGSKRALQVANENRESSRSSGRSSKIRLRNFQTPDPYCPTLETPPGGLLELLVNVKKPSTLTIVGAEILAEPFSCVALRQKSLERQF